MVLTKAEPLKFRKYNALCFNSIIPFQYQLVVDVALTWGKPRHTHFARKYGNNAVTVNFKQF